MEVTELFQPREQVKTAEVTVKILLVELLEFHQEKATSSQSEKQLEGTEEVAIEILVELLDLSLKKKQNDAKCQGTCLVVRGTLASSAAEFLVGLLELHL